METIVKKVAVDNSIIKQKSMPLSKKIFSPILFLFLMLSTNISFAHCDTMDGPLIKDAKTAINTNNVNYVLKWVGSQYETELKEAFSLTMKVRKLNDDALVLADKYFFETAVRLHRSGEGVPYTGIKPSGTPIDEKILAADKAIETGNLDPIKDLVKADLLPELESRFNKVLLLRNYNVNNVTEGRKYIEAYVQFFKFAEGEDSEKDHHSHINEGKI